MTTGRRGRPARSPLVPVRGLAGLPHCIAGNVELLPGLFSGGEVAQPSYLRFVIASTFGNPIGGAFFVALLKCGRVVAGERPERPGRGVGLQ